jgi:hypothetical protein
VRDAIPSSPPSAVERCADRLGDLLITADTVAVRLGRPLLGPWHGLLAWLGLGGLALLVVEVAPLPGTVAALLLAVMRSLAIDGDTGSRRAGARRADGGEACGTGE